MASENIGNVYPTKVPGYEDSADIQAALRLYHYGSETYDITNTNTSLLLNPSLAYTLNDIEQQIADAIENPAAAAEVQSTEPVNPVDGFLWVDTGGTYTGGPVSATSIYQNTTPTLSLVDGLLWIKKGTSPLEMYVYDSTANNFIQVV